VSAVVGIDLSSRALDLARLDENHNFATHLRISLEVDGKRSTSWERTLQLPSLMPPASWWDDVYLVAIEAPYGAGTGTVAILNRIVGAIVASLPSALQRPERCWIVRPDEWKGGLGLQGKPSAEHIAHLGLMLDGDPVTQDARDAACLAYWAREANARASAA
jgi:hypothetical protein